jgi:5,10-methylene-tetrahydrofolate dehydrogenase/methenyl tetrahydrofolate cyclohydrolase
VVDVGQVNAQLAPRLDEARLHVDSLISEGVHHGVLAVLTSIGSHYDGTDFDVVGRGCVLGRFESDILAIGNATAQGVEVLTSKISAASIHHQCLSSGV